MKLYKNPPIDSWKEIFKRPSSDLTPWEKRISPIIKDVQENGDQALYQLTKQFDKCQLQDLRVSKQEIEVSESLIGTNLKDAIWRAKRNIFNFHSQQKMNNYSLEVEEGVTCWQKKIPIEKVGLYIPGGSAPLFSTLLMLGIPATIAGVQNITVATPPLKNGTIHPAILFVAKILGINNIYKIGGAQAIAAMAYGTETISKVDKIFGPGNNYVNFAKLLVSTQGTAIDMAAGPSEVAIIADESANPAFLAADLLSQAEHGADSQVVLIATTEEIINKTKQQLTRQMQLLPRKKIMESALEKSVFVLASSIEDAFDMANFYASEHLILAINDAQKWSQKVVNAGSVFVGHLSPESAGDYASGTNHVLPTGGHVRADEGISVDSFMKKISFQKISPLGLSSLGPTIELLADVEGLHAHKQAVSIRLNSFLEK
ncbi:MAG: histidinol dehydrogenase [Bacteriovoracaceae bacterium]|nr:histidinol dehydrogenase [Bacteriovoracaceae bacterium]